MATPFHRADSALLKQISWKSNAILGSLDAEESACQCPLLLPLQQRLLQAEHELSGHSKDVQIARRLLQVDDDDESDLGELNHALVGRALKRLVVYRVYDVLSLILNPSSINHKPVVLRSTVNRPSLESLGCVQLKRWPSAIDKAVNSLRAMSIPINNPPSGSSMIVGDANVTASLMKSVMTLKTQSQGEKILCNIQTACMEIAALLQGSWDFTENKSLMESMSSCDNREKFTPGQLSIPLQLASGVSPIALILPKLLWAQRSNRSVVTTAFTAYGSSKPALLEEAELVLWKAIVAIVQGEKQPLAAVLEAVTTMQSIALGVSEEDAAWFAEPTGAIDDGYGSSQPPATVPANQPNAEGDRAEQPVSGEQDSTTVTPAVPTTRLSSSATETLASRRTPRKIPENNHPNTPEQRSTTQTRKPRTKRPVKQHQPSTRSSNIAREIKKPVPPPPSEIDIKHLKPGLISEHFFVRVIPLSAKLPEQPSLASLPRLTSPRGYEKISIDETFLLYGVDDDQGVHYTPAFHCAEDLSVFQEMYQCMPRENIQRIFYTCMMQDYENWAVEAVMARLSKAHLVVEDVVPRGHRFDAPSLLDIFAAGNDLVLIDGTSARDRHVLGTLDDLLESHLAPNGNILSTTLIPSPLIDNPGQISWASDQRAWMDTIDLPYCKRHITPPLSHLRWAVAATNGSLSEWRIGSEGSFTYLDVMFGSLWVIVATEKEGDKDGFASTLLCSLMEPAASNTNLWDMQAIVLSAGNRIFIRPTTPYRVLSLASTIYSGGGFYSMTYMMESFAGVLQSFVYRNIHHQDDHSGAYMQLLQRIVVYLHSIRVTRKLANAGDDSHLGDPKNILSICALVELANVLHSDTYHPDGVSPDQRLLLIHIRKLARTMIRKTMVLRDDSGNSGNTLIRGHAVYMASMLLEALDACVGRGFKLAVPLHAIKLQLEGCLGYGWRTGIKIRGHSFVRQFTLKGTPRMSTSLGAVEGRTPDDDLWLQQQGSDS